MVNSVGVLLGTVYDFLHFFYLWNMFDWSFFPPNLIFEHCHIHDKLYDNGNAINILKKGLECFLQKIINFCIYEVYTIIHLEIKVELTSYID